MCNVHYTPTHSLHCFGGNLLLNDLTERHSTEGRPEMESKMSVIQVKNSEYRVVRGIRYISVYYYYCH